MNSVGTNFHRLIASEWAVCSEEKFISQNPKNLKFIILSEKKKELSIVPSQKILCPSLLDHSKLSTARSSRVKPSDRPFSRFKGTDTDRTRFHRGRKHSLSTTGGNPVHLQGIDQRYSTRVHVNWDCSTIGKLVTRFAEEVAEIHFAR